MYYIKHVEQVDWVRKVVGDDSLRVASLKAGQSHNWLHQQVKRGLTTDGIISLCRAYGYPISKALLELEILERSEIASVGVECALKSATNVQLVTEILQRLEPNTGVQIDLGKAMTALWAVQFNSE